ncbi:MAG: FAD-binding protein [Coriobacteriaceae bacterium]|nr:FAD-binding protein [Coriobacteriaceae bacterium]
MPTTDVLVIGGGIAGCIAAIEAARQGARTTLACAGPLFGGSSFYPGTWGLGLIGPEDEADEDDLIETIETVGCGVAEHDLVTTFVRGIRPAIHWLEEDLGVQLTRPSSQDSAHQKEFIPCFDHKNRMWRGITRPAFVDSVGKEIRRLDINVLEHAELMSLVSPNDTGEVCGAIVFDGRGHSFVSVRARSVVLACGGTSGLFERTLTSRDVLSSVHGIAMDAGCALTNIEFMQMMPGLVSPKQGLVFNEKTFRYARFEDPSGLLPLDATVRAKLMETRSGHGPFTSRLGDELVDLAIDSTGRDGIAVQYDFPVGEVPEFVQTFATWLEEEHGISPCDEMRVAMYAHASNGGIRIDHHCSTGVSSLYACGEATGGMHGADRIGGLSSANGLVFGRIAGREAARNALEASGETARSSRRLEVEERDGSERRDSNAYIQDALRALRCQATPLTQADATRLTSDLRKFMSTYCMICRTEEGLEKALSGILALERELGYHASRKGCVIAADDALARSIRLKAQIRLAKEMVRAMQQRTESRGSHYRADAK